MFEGFDDPQYTKMGLGDKRSMGPNLKWTYPEYDLLKKSVSDLLTGEIVFSSSYFKVDDSNTINIWKRTDDYEGLDLFKIEKFDGGWYTVRINEESPEWFKCDNLEGVEKFIRDRWAEATES